MLESLTLDDRRDDTFWEDIDLWRAVAGGGPEMMQRLFSLDQVFGKNLCAGAASCGNLEALQWARDKQTNKPPKGHADERTRDNDFPWRDDHDTGEEAARGGHLELLQWAHANGCEIDREVVCYQAAMGGHLELLQWAHATEGKIDTAACCVAAAKRGHRAVFEWLLAMRVDLMGDVCSSLAKHGDLEGLRQARLKDALWHVHQHWGSSQLSVLEEAAAGHHWQLLLWALQNGCPLPDKSLPSNIMSHRSLCRAIVFVIHQQAEIINLLWDTDQIDVELWLQTAAEAGSLCLLKRLSTKLDYTEWEVEIAESVWRGSFDRNVPAANSQAVMEWLFEMGHLNFTTEAEGRAPTSAQEARVILDRRHNVVLGGKFPLLFAM
eukprot:691404-Prymnesium_polylepis.1